MEKIKRKSAQTIKDTLIKGGVNAKTVNGYEFERQEVPLKGIFADCKDVTIKVPNSDGKTTSNVTYGAMIVVNEEGEEIGTVAISRLFQGICIEDEDGNYKVFEIKNDASPNKGHYMIDSKRLNSHLKQFGKSDLAILSDLIGREYHAKVMADQIIPNLAKDENGTVYAINAELEKAQKGFTKKDLHKFTIGEIQEAMVETE